MYSTIVWIVVGCSFFLPRLWRWFKLYVRLPWRIRKLQIIRVDRPFEQTTAGQLTPDLRNQFGKWISLFAAAGFTVAANVRLAKSVGKASAFQVLMINRSSGQIALLVSASNTLGQLHGLNVLIRNSFKDGTEIATAMNPTVPAEPGVGGVDTVSFPWIQSVNELCEAHRRRLQNAGRVNEPTVVFEPGGELAYITARYQQVIDSSVRSGYRWLDSAAGVLRFTLKGAYLTSWRTTSPWKDRRVRRRDRQSRRMWNKLGMDQWTDPSTQVFPHFSAPVVQQSAVAIEPAPVEGQLQYRAEFLPGDVRWSRAGNVLTVIGRNSTVGMVLTGFIVNLVMVVIFPPFVLFECYVLYHFGRLHLTWSMGIFVASDLFLIYRLFKAIRRSGGIAKVTVEPGRLRFEKAPAMPRKGEFRTDQMTGVMAVTVKSARAKSQTVLMIGLHSGISLAMMISPDDVAMKMARKEIAVTLGIEHP